MTPSTPPSDRPIERVRHVISVIGFGIIVASLVSGLALSLAGQQAGSITAYTIAASLLLALPVSGVIAALFEEIKRRDWWFAAAALGVLILIGYRLLELLP